MNKYLHKLINKLPEKQQEQTNVLRKKTTPEILSFKVKSFKNLQLNL